jgi:hypothetical protein
MQIDFMDDSDLPPLLPELFDIYTNLNLLPDLLIPTKQPFIVSTREVKYITGKTQHIRIAYQSY